MRSDNLEIARNTNFQYSTFRVLIRNTTRTSTLVPTKLACEVAWSDIPKHNNGSSIVMIEINPLGHLPSCDGKQHCSSPIVASSSVVLKGDRRLIGVRGLNENEFVLPYFREDILMQVVHPGSGQVQ